MANGYTASYSLYSVNKDTWADGARIPNLAGASITKDADSDLIEDISLTIDGEIPRGYVRLVMEVTEGGAERIPLCTALVSSVSRKIKGQLETREVSCFSVLKPAAAKLLTPGWYVPRGSDPVSKAAELLKSCIDCPIEYSYSDILTSSSIVAERGESALSMATKLLNGTGYAIRIDGNGRVTVAPEVIEAVSVLDAYSNDIVLPEISDENNFSEVPNVFMAVKDGAYAIVKNEDSQSETSIEALGWEQWQMEDVNNLNGKSLLYYAASKLEELSSVSRAVSYRREFDKSINVNDVISIRLPQAGIVGEFRVVSQQISTERGIVVDERAVISKQTWRM